MKYVELTEEQKTEAINQIHKGVRQAIEKGVVCGAPEGIRFYPFTQESTKNTR